MVTSPDASATVPEAAAVWLDVENVSAEEAKSFIWKNCKEPKFITRAVTNKINKATYQKPDCSLDIDKSKSSLKHFFGKKKPSVKTVKNEASQKHSEQFALRTIKTEIKHEIMSPPIQIKELQKKGPEKRWNSMLSSLHLKK